MCYASFFFYPRWKNAGSEATISWDVSGYYWYLPSVFIYNDLKHQAFKDDILKKYLPTNNPTDFQQAIRLENGDYVMKYASGMAVMYLPFFATAHFIAPVLGYPQDGFSVPYQFAIQFGGLLISLIGLWYLRKLLLLFYEDKVVAIAICILVIGSNYLNYAAIDCGMSHCWLFTVYVFLILNTHYFYQTFKTKYAFRIGFLVGLAALTRPSDALSCIIPLFWGLDSLSISSIKNRFTLYFKHFRQLLLAGLVALCVLSIQLIYWKYATGHWLFYSYDQNQHLYFRSPNFFDYTFSYRSGWLTYTPIMIFAFIGIIPFLMRGKNRIAIITFFLLNYYIVCSWNIWWYGGRAMVQSYPVLIFPVAALVQVSMNRKLALVLFSIVAAGFMYYNIWVTYAYHKGTIYDAEIMSGAYFWKAAGRWDAVPEDVTLLKDNPEIFEGELKNSRIIYRGLIDSISHEKYLIRKSLVLTKEHQISPDYVFPFADKNAEWLKVTASFHCTERETNIWKMAQFIVRLKNNGNVVKENMVRVHRVLHENETKPVSIFMKLPDASYDSVTILFWNGDSEYDIQISDLEAASFNE
jgi:hypothetical protein